MLLAGLAPSARGQTYKSQIKDPIVRYKMSARLDPATNKITGRYTLTWRNRTDDAIPDLYFHLYLNAFKNVDSTFMRESIFGRRRERLKGWRATPEENKWGWLDVNKIQIVGGADLTAAKSFVQPDDANAADQTVLRVALPRPIPPRGSIELAVDFTSKLPRAFTRTGYAGDYVLVAQWFPKIGVYAAAGEGGRTEGGWNCHQFHADTEFYADYGSYDVELTVPSNFVVGATGFLRHQHPNPDGTTTYNFFQEDVHDFAWTASPHFIKLTRTFDGGGEVRADELVAWTKILQVPADEMALGNVSVTLLLQPDHRSSAERYFRAVFNAIKWYGLWYGAYPYDTLTLVDPPSDSNTGGMEYPTLITGGTRFWPGARDDDPEDVTVHEFGHQFWYGLVANNEFEEAFLDEGLNTYSTSKVMELAYPTRCEYRYMLGIPLLLRSWFSVKAPAFPFAGVESVPLGAYGSCLEISQRLTRRAGYLPHASDDVLVRKGWQYMHGTSYSVNSYGRVALALRALESYLGEETMARVMRAYHQRWRFRHPRVQDFIAVVNEVSGRDMNWFFEQFFFSANRVDYAVTDITITPLEGKVGIYDEAGKKAPYLEDPAREGFEKSADKHYRSVVLVRRLGEAEAPVDVVVRFEDGEVAREQWDGKYRWVKYVYERPAKVTSAEVDPERKLALDANFTNNSRLAEPDNRAAARWYVRWIFWLENLFFAASFFS